jgi:hypothetical protein
MSPCIAGIEHTNSDECATEAPPYIEVITRRREDITSSSGENNILRTSAASELNIVFNTRI